MPSLGKVVYPLPFQGKYIRTHWDYEHDLKNILNKSGREDDFWNKYQQRLRFLDERKGNCIFRNSWFENLRHAKEFYAIRFDKSEKNIRIIFSFIKVQGVEYAVLLYAFEEKEKKKIRESYRSAIPIAQKRLKEVYES